MIPKAWPGVSGLREGWEGRPIDGPRDGADLGPLPRGVPAGMPDVPLLPEEPDDPALRRACEAARRRLGRPVVPSIYRTLDRWPAFLEAEREPMADPRALAKIRQRLPGLAAEAVRLARTLPVALAIDRERLGPALGAAGAGETANIRGTYPRTMPETLAQILRLLRDLEGEEARARPPAGS